MLPCHAQQSIAEDTLNNSQHLGNRRCPSAPAAALAVRLGATAAATILAIALTAAASRRRLSVAAARVCCCTRTVSTARCGQAQWAAEGPPLCCLWASTNGRSTHSGQQLVRRAGLQHTVVHLEHRRVGGAVENISSSSRRGAIGAAAAAAAAEEGGQQQHVVSSHCQWCDLQSWWPCVVLCLSCAGCLCRRHARH